MTQICNTDMMHFRVGGEQGKEWWSAPWLMGRRSQQSSGS